MLALTLPLVVRAWFSRSWIALGLSSLKAASLKVALMHLLLTLTLVSTLGFSLAKIIFAYSA
jgi:hypothetical protein